MNWNQNHHHYSLRLQQLISRERERERERDGAIDITNPFPFIRYGRRKAPGGCSERKEKTNVLICGVLNDLDFGLYFNIFSSIHAKNPTKKASYFYRLNHFHMGA